MKSPKAIAAVTLAAAACAASPVEQNGDPQLTLSPDSVVVGVFESSPLIATVRDARGAMQHVALQFISRDQRVATVDASGAIHAVAVGSTYVVAMHSDHPDVRDSVRVRVHADSCSGARPDFGGPATAADRAVFAYDVDAPLNLRKTLEYTIDGVEVSTISFSSPGGDPATGMLWDPVTRSGPRPGIVLMHGLPVRFRDGAIPRLERERRLRGRRDSVRCSRAAADASRATTARGRVGGSTERACLRAPGARHAARRVRAPCGARRLAAWARQQHVAGPRRMRAGAPARSTPSRDVRRDVRRDVHASGARTTGPWLTSIPVGASAPACQPPVMAASAPPTRARRRGCCSRR